MKKFSYGFLFLLLTPMLALAYQEEVAPLAGVWTGTIGKHAITACFNGEYRKDEGNYYYQRHLRSINLESTDIKSGGIGTEWKESDGEWHLLLGEQPSDAINGTWTNPDKSRTLPIKLTKVTEFDGERVFDSDGCESWAYLKALAPSPKTLFGPEQVIDGVKYRGVSVTIEGFELIDMETIEVIGNTPAIQSINRQLSEITSVSKITSELLGCWQESFNTKEPQRQQRAKVSMIGPWLMLRLENDADCLKHRSIEVWENTYLWNLESGERENLLSWFQDENTTKPWMNVTLPADLAEFIYERIGTDDPTYDHLDRESFLRCYGDSSPEGYTYRLELFDGGIDFVVPTTSNGSCGDSFKIPFDELGPFLTEKGEAAVAQFRKFSAAKKR